MQEGFLHGEAWHLTQRRDMLFRMKTRRSNPKRGLRRIYLKEWREYRDLSQETLAERVDSTGATISRLENAKQPYTQALLEALADALTCEPADIIMRPPGSGDELAAVFSDMSPETQVQALAVMRALKGRAA